MTICWKIFYRFPDRSSSRRRVRFLLKSFILDFGRIASGVVVEFLLCVIGSFALNNQ